MAKLPTIIKPIFVKTKEEHYININNIRSYEELQYWCYTEDKRTWWRELKIVHLNGYYETVNVLNEDYEKYFMR